MLNIVSVQNGFMDALVGVVLDAAVDGKFLPTSADCFGKSGVLAATGTELVPGRDVITIEEQAADITVQKA